MHAYLRSCKVEILCVLRSFMLYMVSRFKLPPTVLLKKYNNVLFVDFVDNVCLFLLFIHYHLEMAGLLSCCLYVMINSEKLGATGE